MHLGMGNVADALSVMEQNGVRNLRGEDTNQALSQLRKKGASLTHAGKLQPAIAPRRHLLVDLEPDGAGPVPGRGRLARRHLGHPAAERARVEDVGRRLEGDGAAGLDAVRRRRAAPARLEAPDRLAVDVLDRPVGLPVGRPAHVLPGARARQVGERVWVLLFWDGSVMIDPWKK